MPRRRSVVASPDPASFCSCRLLESVVSCHIGHPNRFLVPSRAPSNLSVYQLCHLGHHRICLSTNHAMLGIIESFLFFTSSFRSRPRHSDQTRLYRSCYITPDYTCIFQSHLSCLSPLIRPLGLTSMKHD